MINRYYCSKINEIDYLLKIGLVCVVADSMMMRLIQHILNKIRYYSIYLTIFFQHLQDTFLKVLLRFIGDSDVRVREGSAKTLSQMAHNLFFPIDNTDEVTLVVSIGHFPAFYVVFVSLEYVPNTHSTYVIVSCFVLFKKKEGPQHSL